jgi:gliding motility-associated-like protein
MKDLLRILLLFALLPHTIYPLYAQEPATQHTRYAGKDFWITTQYTGTVTDFFISSKHNATATFTYTTNNSSYTVSIPANTVVTMPSPQMNLASMPVFETIQDKSLHIVTDSDVVVQYAYWGGFTDDGTLVYPSDRQQYGNVYYLNGLPQLLYAGSASPNGGGFSIVATCDSVLLEITPAKDLSGHLAGIPFTITLNKGQTYAIGSSATNPIRDISGTKIEVKSSPCCNPINVFNTGTCGFSYWPYTGSSAGACDFFFEQLLPVSSWDTSYYLLPYCNNPYTIIKIVSSGNNNPVTFNGTTIATLNEGGTLDTIIREPVYVASLLPVSISQHMVSMEVSLTQPSTNPPADSLSDPNSAMAISMRDGIREAWFHTVGQSISGPWGNGVYNGFHALAIISKAVNVGTILLNNNSLATQFHPFPGNPGYMYAYIKPDTGILYHLTSADKIVANYYAATNCGSLDFALGDVNPYVFFNELPTDTINVCAMDTSILNAGPGSTYEWSTGATTSEIVATDTGLYSVLKHTGGNNCTDDLKKFVIRRYPRYLKPMDLGADTTICKGEQIILNGQGLSTVWSTGESGASITVRDPGIYWAMLEDTCALEIVADTMVLADDLCLWRYCTFNIPNAFSPNGDGLNDVLLPVYRGQLDKYSLNIFNRLGQRVFSSSKPEEGWDGNINGQPADIGVYFYNCLFYCPLGGYINRKGDVSLIR